MATPEFLEAIDGIPENRLEDAVSDYLCEHNLLYNFLEWLDNWKDLRKPNGA